MSSKRILLVEDDPNLGMLLEDYLSLKGKFEVKLCKDGDEGLKAFTKKNNNQVFLPMKLNRITSAWYQPSQRFRLAGKKKSTPHQLIFLRHIFFLCYGTFLHQLKKFMQFISNHLLRWLCSSVCTGNGLGQLCGLVGYLCFFIFFLCKGDGVF